MNFNLPADSFTKTSMRNWHLAAKSLRKILTWQTRSTCKSRTLRLLFSSLTIKMIFWERPIKSFWYMVPWQSHTYCSLRVLQKRLFWSLKAHDVFPSTSEVCSFSCFCLSDHLSVALLHYCKWIRFQLIHCSTYLVQLAFVLLQAFDQNKTTDVNEQTSWASLLQLQVTSINVVKYKWDHLAGKLLWRSWLTVFIAVRLPSHKKKWSTSWFRTTVSFWSALIWGTTTSFLEAYSQFLCVSHNSGGKGQRVALHWMRRPINADLDHLAVSGSYFSPDWRHWCCHQLG